MTLVQEYILMYFWGGETSGVEVEGTKQLGENTRHIRPCCNTRTARGTKVDRLEFLASTAPTDCQYQPHARRDRPALNCLPLVNQPDNNSWIDRSTVPISLPY